VTVDLWYYTGARNERPGRSGFAHLFEHMMFQGSAHVKKSEHFQLVERAGGTLNGSTHDDYTNYYETIPSNRLNLALWLEADRMRSLAVTQENLENQRATVKEEKRLRRQPAVCADVSERHCLAVRQRDVLRLRPCHHRLDGRPRCREAGRRPGVLRHVLRAQQRHPGRRG